MLPDLDECFERLAEARAYRDELLERRAAGESVSDREIADARLDIARWRQAWYRAQVEDDE